VLGFTLALVVATASAEERTTILKVRPFAAPAAVQPIFSTAPAANPAAAAAQFGTTSNEHQFGVGARLGGLSNGVGGNVRYFFYSGPLGVQADVWRYGLDFGNRDFSGIQFIPSVIYRFVEYKLESPMSLTPFVGAGLSFIHSRFGTNSGFFSGLGVDDTDFGVVAYGGVEMFFDRVPGLGASGELLYSTNDDISSGGFGTTSLGGVSFIASAHWYFW
jgi:hypothetical protein